MNNFKTYFPAVFFILTGFLFSQNYAEQENDLLKSEKLYAIEKGKLDSINSSLQELLLQLNINKKQNSADHNKIRALMANAHSISSQADKQQEIVSTIVRQIKTQRVVLYKKYSALVDSLRNVLEKESDQPLHKTESRLKELTVKRASYSPALPLFSFDPQLIAQIKPSKSADKLENSIYNEYLMNALSEIDSNISVLKNKKSEVSTMILLDEKTEDFIDELSESQFLSSIAIENENNQSVSRFNDGSDFTSESFTNDILKIYEQLGPVMNELVDTPTIAGYDSLATDEYLLLLQDTEKTLNLYKKIIKEKMTQN